MPDDMTFPILRHDATESTVFLPRNLLEQSRSQKGLRRSQTPEGCALDFDGELVDYLVRTGRARLDSEWPCFHTRLYRWSSEVEEFGIIGGTVGAPFAVLVAEELFASGCRALMSVGSAGLLDQRYAPPFFLLIERAMRDEGTSYHYLPPAEFAEADESLLNAVETAFAGIGIGVRRGASWTTDAPFRETARQIETYRQRGLIAVEMEAAALLAFAKASQRPVVCVSHVTNAMATQENDFDKGGDESMDTTLRLCETALRTMIGWKR